MHAETYAGLHVKYVTVFWFSPKLEDGTFQSNSHTPHVIKIFTAFLELLLADAQTYRVTTLTRNVWTPCESHCNRCWLWELVILWRHTSDLKTSELNAKWKKGVTSKLQPFHLWAARYLSNGRVVRPRSKSGYNRMEKKISAHTGKQTPNPQVALPTAQSPYRLSYIRRAIIKLKTHLS